MIERISELPFFGPEEQLRKFINHYDETNVLNVENVPTTQNVITQIRIGNIDDMLQRQMIWSYGKSGIDDAYFYWDWCPSGDDGQQTIGNTKYNVNWQVRQIDEYQDNLDRNIDRQFDYTKFKGYRNSETNDQMVKEYSAITDEHAREQSTENAPLTIETEALRKNIMRSYLEVSEWLGAAATQYGSHNGFVSRKMSMCWLFDAIRALINFKLNNQDKYAQENIYPLDGTYDSEKNQNGHMERFLNNNEPSEQGIAYNDDDDLDQSGGRCSMQSKVRATHPDTDGVLKVRGNEFHYGERADFYTHNSFIGECRFFHNARFLGQTTFDKEINGTAMRSRWADMAEMYESDFQYEPGTLVMFGGTKEITKSNGKVCNAIITTKPGLILNGDDNTGKLMLGIALVGRVPVKVSGEVKKFDKLVSDSSKPGYARSKRWYDWFKPTLGVALEDGNDSNVECSVKISFD